MHSGLQLLKAYCERGRIHSTTIREIDQLVGNGFTSGQVMEIIGPSLSGKTHLCHAMTARIAASHPPAMGHRVLYIDCAGHFSVAKLLTFVEKECFAEKAAGDREEFHVSQTMRRVSVTRCPNLAELVEYFLYLLDKCKNPPQSSDILSPSALNTTQKLENLPEAIIIDSLAAAFSLMPQSISAEWKGTTLAPDSPHDPLLLERLMAQISLLIRQVAYFGNMAIVVTNPVPVPQLMFSGSYYNAWTSAPHIRLNLSFSESSSSKSSSFPKNDDGNKSRRFVSIRHYTGANAASDETHAGDSANSSSSQNISFDLY